MGYQPITGSADLSTKLRYLDSYSFTENAGTPAAARVAFRDGSSGGNVVHDVQLTASGNAVQAFSKPLYFPNGLYLQVTAGTVRGSVRGT